MGAGWGPGYSTARVDLMGEARNTLANILRAQRRWAEYSGVSFDADGYTRNLTDNLFEPLADDSRAEFSSGGGGELGIDGERGKIQALHSSSALACNVFGYWRHRDPSRVAVSLGATDGEWVVSFEKKLGTGVRGAIANLDVWCQREDDSCIGVESKFCEPYRVARKSPVLSTAYRHSGSTSAWTDAGLPRCHEIAAIAREDVKRWEYVDVLQLLKHLLAMQKRAATASLLRCVWFDTRDDAADRHRAELTDFSSLLAGEGSFAALTHQDIVASLRKGSVEGHAQYFTYLAKRYGI